MGLGRCQEYHGQVPHEIHGEQRWFRDYLEAFLNLSYPYFHYFGRAC